MASYGGLEGIGSALAKSTDHPSRQLIEGKRLVVKVVHTSSKVATLG